MIRTAGIFATAILVACTPANVEEDAMDDFIVVSTHDTVPRIKLDSKDD